MENSVQKIRIKDSVQKIRIKRFSSKIRFGESKVRLNRGKTDSTTPNKTKSVGRELLAITQIKLTSVEETSRNLELSYQIHRCWFELNSRNQRSVHWRLAIINRHAESNTVPAWHKKPDLHMQQAVFSSQHTLN